MDSQILTLKTLKEAVEVLKKDEPTLKIKIEEFEAFFQKLEKDDH